MKVRISPSDLYFKYQRKKLARELPKFNGKPDPNPFDRDDLYEVLPMFSAVLSELGSQDGDVLQRAEEVLNRLPGFIDSREQVFDALVEALREYLEDRY